MDAYSLLIYAHVISSTVLFGTGMGTAFAMVAAHFRARHSPAVVATVAENVALADWVFTTPAVIVQPLTGAAMIHIAGYSWFSDWIVVSLVLYVITGLCWLPVVWIQIQMGRHARDAANEGRPLPPEYHRLFKWWFALGWPAFAAVMGIFWLMIHKPELF
jgi:uncharacterized membrane protein